jgi:hypothetical protein
MLWGERIRKAERAARMAGKHIAAKGQAITAQGLNQARLAGTRLARKITAIQQAAGLNDKLIRRSVRTVAERTLTRESDQAFRHAYLSIARPAEHVRVVRVPERPGRTLAARPAPDSQAAKWAERDAGGREAT